MNQDSPTHPRDQVKARLDALAATDAVHAVALISRDGICVQSSARTGIPLETFGAMVATAMGAAETALLELGGADAQRLDVLGDRHRIVAVGLSPDLLLVAVTDPTLPQAKAFELLEGAVQDVAPSVR